MNESNLTYEQAIKKLSDIVEKLSSQSVPLSEASKFFEEGGELIKFCYSSLKTVKGKLLEIKNTLDGLKMEEEEN